VPSPEDAKSSSEVWRFYTSGAELREEIVDESHARVVVQGELAVEAFGGFLKGLLV
jgi:hypothetical protein